MRLVPVNEEKFSLYTLGASVHVVWYSVKRKRALCDGVLTKIKIRTDKTPVK